MQRSLPRLPLWIKNPALQLVAAGIATWLAYLHLTASYPLPAFVLKYPLTDFGRANNYSQPAMLDYVLSLAIPFALYLLAWRIVARQSYTRRWLALIFGFAVLFAATLLLMYPIGAVDLFNYVFSSRILVHYGRNPLIDPPILFVSDPFARTVVWPRTPSPYGPLWHLLIVPGALIARDDLVLNLLVMKALPILFYLGSIGLVALILRKTDPHTRLAGTLLFAWNPLVLFEIPGNGHNGMIMQFFVLVAVYCLVKRWWVWVLPALMASVLIKYASAMLILPFLIYCWRAQTGLGNRIKFFVKTSAISVLLGAVMIFPFVGVPAGLLDEASWHSLLAAPTLLFHLLRPGLGENDAKMATVVSTSILYALLYLASVRFYSQNDDPHRLVLLGVWLKVAYFVIACVYFMPWFILWIIALGIWVNHALTRRVLLVFTATGLLSYAVNFFWVWNWTVWQKFQVNIAFVSVLFGPPILIAALTLIQKRWRRPGIPAPAISAPAA